MDSVLVAVPRQRARRHRLVAAPSNKRTPTGRKSGTKAHPIIPVCRVPSAACSTAFVVTGRRACGRLASQLRVKLGMTRPPTTEISTITPARPRRHPRPGGAAMPAASSCIKRSAIARTVTGATIGRLRQFRPATISRAITPANATGKARSAATASQTGISAETRPAIRPSSHKPAKLASGSPLTGSRPVQFGIAVNRKPAIAASAKPNSISWMCQVKGSNRLGSTPPLARMVIHSASAAADQTAAARKNGRNPRVRKAGTERPAKRSAAMLMMHHRQGAPPPAGPEGNARQAAGRRAAA